MKFKLAVLGMLFMGISAQNAFGKEFSLNELGVSAELPDSWQVKIQQQDGNVFAYLTSPRDRNQSVFAGCAITRQQLPERFRLYTQERINVLRAEKPFTAANFSEQLQAVTGMPHRILSNGESMLDTSQASWAVATSSESSGGITVSYMSKIYLTQTPGYAWNVRCISGSPRGTDGAAKGYESNQAIYDRFFQTFHYIDVAH